MDGIEKELIRPFLRFFFFRTAARFKKLRMFYLLEGKTVESLFEKEDAEVKERLKRYLATV